MSSRGRFSSRFIKSGTHHKPYYSDRDKSFRRHERGDRYRRSFTGGRDATKEHYHNQGLESERHFEHSSVRKKEFLKHISRPYIRSSRSRYLRGKQYHSHEVKKDIESLGNYKHKTHRRFSVKSKCLFNDKFEDEDFLNFSGVELQYPIESIDSSDENDFFDDCKMSLELSPLIIHRNFEKKYFKSGSREQMLESRSRSRSPLDSRSVNNKNYDSRYSKHFKRSRHSLQRSLPRSHSASHEKTVSIPPDHNKRSKSNDKRSKERECSTDKYMESDSLSYIKEQIKLEKQRQRFLEHQKRMNEKKSESSVERLLNDCKKSIEFNSKFSSSHVYNSHVKNSIHNEQLLSYNDESSCIVDLETVRHLNKSLQNSHSDNSDNKTQKNINSFDLRSELSPISQTGYVDVIESSSKKLQLSPISQIGSYEKREFSSDHKTCLENLSPISQTESFEDDNFNENPIENELVLSPISQESEYDQIDMELELSPISQIGSFEEREFSKEQMFSPISHSEIFENDDNKYGTTSQKPEVERPNSNDSMQKFLEQFRYCDRSRSPSLLSSIEDMSKHSVYPKTDTNEPANKNNSDKDHIGYHKAYPYSGRYVAEVRNKKDQSSSKSLEKSEFQEIRCELIVQSPELNKSKYDYTNLKHTTYKDRVKRKSYFKSSDSLSDCNNQCSKRDNYLALTDEKRYQRSQDETQLGNKQNISAKYNDMLEERSQCLNHQSSIATFNNVSGMSKHLNNLYDKSRLDENLNTQIQNTQAKGHNVNLTASQRTTLFNDKSSDFLLFNKNYPDIYEGYVNLKQGSQVPQILTNVNSSLNHRNINNQQFQPIIELKPQPMPFKNNYYNPHTQAMPHNSLSFGGNVPNSMPGIMKPNLHLQHDPYQVGQRNQCSERSVQNIHGNQHFSQNNRYLLHHSNTNNQPHVFDKGYGIIPADSLYQINEADKMPPSTISFGNVNSSLCQGPYTQSNNSCLNQGQSYLPQETQFSQSQIQGIHGNYMTLNHNQTVVQSLPPVLLFHPTTGAVHNSNERLERPPAAQTFKPMLGSTNQHSSVQPAYNIPKLLFNNPEMPQKLNFEKGAILNQHTSCQKNISSFRADLLFRQYNNKIFNDAPRDNKIQRNSNLFLKDTRNDLEPSTMIFGTDQSFRLSKPTCIDLKTYLTGTFKSGYKRALCLNEVKVSGYCEYSFGEKPQVRECFPAPIFITKFKDTPPLPEELGFMFDKFVIFFDVRQNSDLEKDPFVVIQDSFSKSDRFGRLDVEEQSQMSYSIFQSPPVQL